MAKLSTKIKLYMGSDVDFINDVTIRYDESNNPYISYWSSSLAKDKPTDEQIASYEAEATKLDNNETIRAKRKALYGDVGDQLDEMYKDMDAWKTRIKSIKDANPKE
tara:strand:+ start:63 stop:383 length:321 start_codon:yes stop_codon:yes gene_type:complete